MIVNDKINIFKFLPLTPKKYKIIKTRWPPENSIKPEEYDILTITKSIRLKYLNQMCSKFLLLFLLIEDFFIVLK